MDTQSTVLVAEDSRTQTIQMQWLLEQAGYRTVMTPNGREALNQIRQSPPDVVVTGMEMPEMSGLELVKAVHAEFPGILIVLATAAGSEAIAAEALRKGAAIYVPKRSLIEDLVPTLKRLLAVAHPDLANTQLAACATYSEVQFRLTTDDGQVALLVAQLMRMIERFGLRDVNGAMRVATAVDEALQNAILHGNLEISSKLREGEDTNAFHELVKQRRQQAPFKDRHAHVRACMTTESAEFVIRDEGPGFDPRSIPDPTDPKYFDRPGGRGLWLIHAFMDEVRHNELGNEITMILRKKGT